MRKSSVNELGSPVASKFGHQPSHFSRAGSSIVNVMNNGSVVADMGNHLVQFEDPVAALNLSDDKWNDIVQRNAREFKQENERKVQEQMLKNRAVMEEQKK